MIPRERVEAVLNFKEVDIVPVIPPFQGFWALDAVGLSIPSHYANPMKGAEAQIKMIEAAPFDALEVFWDWLTPAEACGCKVVFPEKSNPNTSEHVLKTIDEVSKLKMPDISGHARSINDFKVAASLNKSLSKERYTYITLPLPFTLSGELRGVEKMMLDMLKKPNEVGLLLDYSAKVMLEYAKFAAETGVDGICWCDPTASAGLISPKHFKNFALPRIKEVLQKTRSLGMDALLHICGNTSDRLDAILDASPDLMSLDTSVDLAKAMQVLLDKVPIMGNVSTTDLFTKKPEDIEAASLDCIKRAGKHGFALGAGCDIPIGSPLANVVALCSAPKRA
jgi:uroporphyrinogen decarboxylase